MTRSSQHARRSRLIVTVLVTALLILGAGGAWAVGAGTPAGLNAGRATSAGAGPKIEARVLADTAGGLQTSFVVLLSEQADLHTAYAMTDQTARGWYVYNTLSRTATRTQAGILALLQARGIPYQSFWAANAIVTSGDRALVETLAARADVRVIESNAATRWIADPPVANLAPAPVQAPAGIEWGVQNVQAPQVWQLGYTGQGIVIGVADTGMQWDHPALKPHYRGWNGTAADHNYNWHDAIHDSQGNPCGNDSRFPCDDWYIPHGTHTTGTTSGDDGAGNQIGVAPGAKWIGCRNMDYGNGTPARYTECFQFFIAPTDLDGHNPNPALRPDVINNSWGCQQSEGCAADTLRTIVENTQAAGIFVEVSAGNSGSGCGSVTDPPAIYAAAFSTGAIDSANFLADFSSRGPVTVDGSNRLKPNISAPGVNVRSSIRGNTYETLSGTSMAGPHVVGVVALLWSAHPGLKRQITETKTLLQQTANPNVVVSPPETCGGTPSNQIPNNSFGYGRVDALAAVNAVPFSTPSPTPIGCADSRIACTTTPTRTPSSTPTTTPSNTPLPSNTPTDTATTAPTDTATTAPTDTATTAPTDTATTAPTDTALAAVSSTPTLVPTDTATRTPMAAPSPTFVLCRDARIACTATPAVTATAGPVCNPGFTDVQTTDYFYTPVIYLACHGIISGYADHTFRPYNFTTRGQMVKIVVGAFQISVFEPPPGEHTFADVDQSNPFFVPIEAAAHDHIVGGYGCGSAAEPCDNENRPYFRPNAYVTRGQLTKITVVAAGWVLQTPATATFSDVPVGSTYYPYVETAVCHSIISGYADGTFRPGNNTVRGQIAKIVYGALTTGQAACAAATATPAQ